MDEYTFVMVEAGAGSGKTTLLTSYIDYCHIENVKWMTMDHYFNEAFMFFEYFIELFHDEIDIEKYRLFFQDSFMKEGLYQIVFMICTDLQQLEKQYIVLDNIHYLQDDFLCELIELLFDHMPLHIHMILLGRTMSQVHFGKYYANNQVLSIPAHEFVMSEREASEFLTQTLSLPYDHQLIQMANGWVVALQLLATFSSHVLDDMMQMDILEDYIEKELLKDWEKQIAEFISLSAVLDYFDAGICECLFPDFSFSQTIQLLMHHHMLLVELDAQEGIYTYHDLIKDYLRKKFKLRNQSFQSQFLGEVSDYFENKGQYDECLKYLLMKQDYERMMELIVSIPQSGKTLAYLPKVPISEIVKNADFAIQYFFYFYVNSDEKTCLNIYQKTNDFFQNHPSSTIFENMKLYVEDRIKTRSYPTTSLNSIMSLHLSEMTKAIILLKDTFILYLRDEVELAKDYLKAANIMIQRQTYAYLHYFYYITSAQFYEYVGEYEKSIHYFKKSHPFLENLPHLKVGYYIGIAGVYIKQVRIQEAQSCFDLLKELKGLNECRMMVAYYQTLIQLLYLQDNDKLANELWDQFFQTCESSEIIYLGHILQMRYSNHMFDSVFDLFEHEYQSCEEDELDSDTHILHALILYSHHQEDEALSLFEKTLSYCRKKQLRLNLIEINIYLILYYSKHYTSKQIKGLWKEAIYYIFKEHIYLPFWLIRHDINQFIHICERFSLLDELSLPEKQTIMNLLPHKSLLTSREQDVMQLLQKGYTNKQIAETLHVSLATVKTHLINIFSKLQVNNRIEALTKYQEMYE